ncbi:ead/Ea22-like family protein [Enterobacter hormaechei subsp. hoffmannii]|nr:ead/Ea22-like family protein [Enterobacter hormaechei subsp. hoffmannii]MCU2953957.1 ead/Ea22-like family protein [Enterobacter hormaechei subsp. hoffmannii]
MSNIDKQALREAAELFNSEEGDHWWDEEQLTHEDGLGLNEADGKFIATANPATVLALLDELEAAEKRIAELEVLARGVKQFSEFQICHYGATEDYAKGYIDCQNNYNKVLFAAASKGE